MTEKYLPVNGSREMDSRPVLYIIKAGGNVIDNEPALHSFLKDFASVTERKILVHGGGKIATAIGEKLGIVPDYVEGRRITNEETLDLVTMVYGGLLNKKMVAALQSLQCDDIGITGADGNALPAKKRPVKKIDYGWVGDITSAGIDPRFWQVLLDNSLVPVVASLTHDGHGHMLNTNADTIAAVLSVCLSSLYRVKLIYCFEKNGVLQDIDDDHSLVALLNRQTYQDLKEDKKLFAGILPKIENALDAVDNGVEEVVIGNSASLLQLIKGENGTRIILS
jgi:acetylglutamate kinase